MYRLYLSEPHRPMIGNYFNMIFISNSQLFLNSVFMLLWLPNELDLGSIMTSVISDSRCDKILGEIQRHSKKTLAYC